jgi:Trm5-related predicted tRNA methylase
LKIASTEIGFIQKRKDIIGVHGRAPKIVEILKKKTLSSEPSRFESGNLGKDSQSKKIGIF